MVRFQLQIPEIRRQGISRRSRDPMNSLCDENLGIPTCSNGVASKFMFDHKDRKSGIKSIEFRV